MIQLALSLARNTARLAMSSGSPRRLVGIRRGEVVAEVLDEVGGEVGLHQPGGDADDPRRAELAGELAGEVDQRRLGHVVDAEAELGAQPPTEAMLMITPGWSLNACSHACWRPEQRPAQVDLERLVVARLVDPERGPVVRVGAGVVDEDVEAAEALDRGVDARHGVASSSPALAAKHVAVVAASISAAAASSWSCLRLLSITLAPGVGEPRGDRLADALRRPGDERDLAVE